MNTIVVQITTYCPFNCKQCYMEHTNEFMSLDKMNEIISFAKENNVQLIQLTGGEPLAHPNVLEIIKLIKASNIKVTIATSGYSLDEKSIMNFKEIGLDVLCVSLNGSNERINNQSREAFNCSLNAIKLCKENDLSFVINWVPNEQNIYDLTNIIQIAHKNNALGICILKPMKPFNHEKEEIDLLKFGFLIALCEQYKEYLFVEECYYELNNRLNNENKWCINKQDRLFIDVNGNYSLCTFQSEVLNLKFTSYDEYIKNNKLINNNLCRG